MGNSCLFSKKQRIGGFETFLRSLVREGFECDITEEQIPDFRHEIWNVKKEKEVYLKVLSGEK